MNELDEMLVRLGDALDDGLNAAAPRAADQARVRLFASIESESRNDVVRGRRGSRRPGGYGRWFGVLAIGLSSAVSLVVLAVALGTRGHRAVTGASVPTVLPFGSILNPSGPTG